MKKRVKFIKPSAKPIFLLPSLLLLVACNSAETSSITQNVQSTQSTTANDSEKANLKAPATGNNNELSANQQKGFVDNFKGEVPDNAPTYQVLVDPLYPPYSFRDENNNLVGFEVDVLRAIAKREKFNIEFVSSSSDALFDDISREENDLIASALVVNEENKQAQADVVDFSQPYIDTQIVAVFSDESIKSYQDLQDKTIAVKESSSYLPLMIKKLKVADSNVMNYPSSFLSFKAMMTDDADASVGDIQAVFYYMNEYSSEDMENPFKFTPILNDKKQSIAFAVSKDQPELLQVINDGLEKINTDGSYELIAAHWLR